MTMTVIELGIMAAFAVIAALGAWFLKPNGLPRNVFLGIDTLTGDIKMRALNPKRDQHTFKLGKNKTTFKLDGAFRHGWQNKGTAYMGDLQNGRLVKITEHEEAWQHPGVGDEMLMDGRERNLARASIGAQQFDWKLIGFAVGGLVLLLIIGKGFIG